MYRGASHILSSQIATCLMTRPFDLCPLEGRVDLGIRRTFIIWNPADCSCESLGKSLYFSGPQLLYLYKSCSDCLFHYQMKKCHLNYFTIYQCQLSNEGKIERQSRKDYVIKTKKIRWIRNEETELLVLISTISLMGECQVLHT